MLKRTGIIIPSYNQGEFLEKAIISVLENKKNADIFLVIIDGGSTDNSVDIIKKYQNNIDYWQSCPDGGQANAINIGVEHLAGCDYIMWLNSDDEYDSPNAVASIVKHAENTKTQVCYAKSAYIDKNGKKIGYYPTIPLDKLRLDIGCFLSQPSVVVSYTAWKAVGGLDERLQMCLDYELWIRLSKIYEFGYYEAVVGNTRIYSETKTATMLGRHLSEAVTILYKQYGKVTIDWIYKWAKYLDKTGIYTILPKRVVKLWLLPWKMAYIGRAQRNCNYN